MTQLYNMKPIITVCPGAPTRLTVNIAAVAAANKVHWTVPQNLLRKPETHANLEKHKIRHLICVLNIFYYKGTMQERDNIINHTHGGRIIPEHGCDYLPGEGEDTNPDTGDGDSLQKLVKLVVCECCKDKKKM